MKKFQCELCGSVDLEKIGDDLFQCQYCGCKYSAKDVKKIIFGEVTFKSQDYEVVGGKLIKYNGSSTDVIIPESVSIIGIGALSDCSGITSVTIPDSVKIIESKAFFRCTSLQSIVLPDSVCEIQSYAFYGCTRLSSIEFSNNLLFIETNAFQKCSSLNQVALPNSVRRVGACAFADCVSLESVHLPESISIDASAFNGATLLTNITGNLIAYLESVKSSYDLEEMSQLNPLCKSYVDEVKLQRRKKKVCEYCGGPFYGVLHKCCERCGRMKNY